MRRHRTTAFGAALSLAVLFTALPASGAAGQHWVAGWAASPTDSITPVDAAYLPVPLGLADQTVRMMVTPHLSGPALRVHLSNRFGSGPVTFGQVTVGAEPVTFGGRTQVTVPAGQDVVSDPVALAVRAFTPLAVSMYLPGVSPAPTKHWNANATSYYSAPLSGNQTAAVSLPNTTEAWFYVDGIDVEAPAATRGIVAFGDSITDGFVAATVLSQPVSRAVADKNGRYPDDLQRRLDAAGIPLSVLDAGISSNQLLTSGEPLFLGPSGLQRLSADALDLPGVTGVLLLEGINDLGLAHVRADQLITGYQQAIVQAHAAGKKLWLGTITPAANAIFDGTLLAPDSETARQQVNAWIRTQKVADGADGADGIVDFDAAVRDPANPSVLNPVYAGPDNLHPNLLGYQAMADAVNLAMLTG